MKEILMSIQPKWCELIASGKKTVEVRKTAPKEVPFKVYMYCTIGGFINKERTIPKEPLFRETHFDGIKYITSIDLADKTLQEYKLANGKVIGEFVCDKIEECIPDYNPVTQEFFYNEWADCSASCLTSKEEAKYGKGKPLKGLHISELKTYDNPRELGEFRKPCPYGASECMYDDRPKCPDCERTITRPPQSWCYVEDMGNE